MPSARSHTRDAQPMVRASSDSPCASAIFGTKLSEGACVCGTPPQTIPL
jgi:hypothetical protein